MLIWQICYILRHQFSCLTFCCASNKVGVWKCFFGWAMRRKILSFIPLLSDIFIFSCVYLLLSCISFVQFSMVNLCRWLLHRLVIVQEFVSIRLRWLLDGGTLISLTFWHIGIILIPVLLVSKLIESMFFIFPYRWIIFWKFSIFEERLGRLIILWMHIKQLLRSDNPALILISNSWPLKLDEPKIALTACCTDFWMVVDECWVPTVAKDLDASDAVCKLAKRYPIQRKTAARDHLYLPVSHLEHLRTRGCSD